MNIENRGVTLVRTNRQWRWMAVMAVVPSLCLLCGCGKRQGAERAFEKGVFFLENGETDAAVAAFTEAIQIKPDYADAFYNRGTTYSEKGDLDRAIDDYTEAKAGLG